MWNAENSTRSSSAQPQSTPNSRTPFWKRWKNSGRKEEALDQYSEEKSATGDPRGRLVQYPMLSGLLSIPNMRADGSVAQIGQTDRTVENIEYRVYKVRGTFAADLNTIRYPFDSHRIGVELQAAVPDHLLTLTAQRVESTAFEENQRGWILNWIHGLVDNRVANGNPLALSNDHTVTRQFKEFAIMVGSDPQPAPTDAS